MRKKNPKQNSPKIQVLPSKKKTLKSLKSDKVRIKLAQDTTFSIKPS